MVIPIKAITIPENMPTVEIKRFYDLNKVSDGHLIFKLVNKKRTVYYTIAWGNLYFYDKI